MTFGMILTAILISVTNLTITEPVDGETYDGDWLSLRAIVENENELPDSVHYELNGQSTVLIPRLNTDWYTYMANDCRTGYSESPAPHDNSILWTAPISGTYHEFVSPVVVDGRVYYASEEDEIAYCLDAATGAEIWRFENIGDAIDDAMHVQDGKAYLASDSIWCLDALTGDRIWAFGNAANGFRGTPVPYQEKVFVSSHVTHCLDGLTGVEIWRSDTLITTGCMTAWNGMLFVPTVYLGGGVWGSLYALDANTGAELWEFEDGNIYFWDSSPVLFDSTIYIGACGNEANLYAIDPFDGSGVSLWGPFEGSIESTPAVFEDRIFFGAYPLIYCLNRFTGDVEWEFDPPGQNFLHGSCGVADGLVFWGDFCWFPSDSLAIIHAVDINTGNEIWSYETKGGPLGIQSSPSIVDGVMYIAATDNNLYAFGTGLKYTYKEDYFYVDIASNELIVTSFDGGAAVAADTINFTVTQTGITLEPSSRLALCASPNPFYSTASISFELSEPGWTSVMVYDLSGRIVRTLENSELGTGQHSIVWDGRKENGEVVSGGLYMCRIQSGGISETTGLCLLR
ncbi:MAG: PQQ-binding-like beta-propeller repeat protein [Candidatus Aegiribacteria sp.]|nr:PQQ-binding-like beta-propeller repeat protein [Candidatus Aegiribacteria sp.]